MDEIILGDVSITRVMEYLGSVQMSPKTFFPESPASSWRDNEDWLARDFYDPAADACISAIQTWLLRSEGKTILIDTGVGNHKERPYSPVWSHLDTDFLGNLAKAGVQPGDVDIVVNTHLHVDHVGWNTYLHERQWVPTFPNANYLIPRPDFEYWNPDNDHRPRLGRGNQNVFEDSVAPVRDAGRIQLWDDDFRIDANLRLDLAPGHTPGSSAVTLESGNDRALFVGDLLHTPLQFVEPDTNTLVFPAHLGGHGGAELSRDGDRFTIKRWAPFGRMPNV